MTAPAPRWLVALAWIVPIGVLIQAILAGQAWFSSPSLFALHGGMGHGVLLASVLLATFSWLVRVPRVVAILASLATLGLLGQTGLGFAGRRGGLAVASSLHIPLGASLLAVTTVVAVLLTVRQNRA